MSSRSLPARPHLDHLKNEAKALLKAIRSGERSAIERAHVALGDKPATRLTDAQRILAREYGFGTWARLRAHVLALHDIDAAVTLYLQAIQMQDKDAANRILAANARIADESLHVAATLGLRATAHRIIEQDRAAVSARIGNPAADPLLFLAFTPFHGESEERDVSLLATARLLLDAGADPNTVDGRYGVSALYAVTGMHNVLPMARMLLDAGANPNDGESVFHAAEKFHEDALDLLIASGADLNHVGSWGNTPLYFLLRWHDVEREARVGQGIRWLLDHGADPNIKCSKEQENSLHVSCRRGQGLSTIRLLIDHGADLDATRGDGSSAWLLAKRAGFEEIAALLEQAGARVQALTQLDLMLAACGRGDAEAARQLATADMIRNLAPSDLLLLPESAAASRDAVVIACLAAGFPVNTLDTTGATALHFAVLHGRAATVRALIEYGAVLEIRDNEHSSTPLGWACFGADFIKDDDGDYAGVVRALLNAGAQMHEEHQSADPGVDALLQGESR